MVSNSDQAGTGPLEYLNVLWYRGPISGRMVKRYRSMCCYWQQDTHCPQIAFEETVMVPEDETQSTMVWTEEN